MAVPTASSYLSVAHPSAQRARWRLMILTAAALVTLCCILWAAISAAQQPCCTTLIGAPDSLPLPLFRLLATMFSAAGLWAIGFLVTTAGPQPRNRAWLFLLTCYLSAGALAGDLLSVTGVDPEQRLLYVQLAWLAPLTIHYHMRVTEYTFGWPVRAVLGAQYAAAVLRTGWIIASLFPEVPLLGNTTAWRTDILISLGASVLLGLGLLPWAYRHATGIVQQRLRIIIFGTLLGVCPIITLTLLDVFSSYIVLPYYLVFPLMLVSPFAYCYALFGDTFLDEASLLHTTLIYYVLSILVAVVYLLLSSTLSLLLLPVTWDWLLVNAAVSAALLCVALAAYQRVRQVVRFVWYGNQSKTDATIRAFAATLARTTELSHLEHLLVDRLADRLGVVFSALYVRDEHGELRLVRARGSTALPATISATLRNALAEQDHAVPYTTARLNRLLGASWPQSPAAELHTYPTETCWLPLQTGQQLHGLALFAPAADSELTAADLRVLAGLAEAAGTSAHTIRLAQQMRAGQQALQRAYLRAQTAQERAQQQIAHDLHDNGIQELLGASYQLAAVKQLTQSPEAIARIEQTRQTLLEVIAQLRGQVGALRPAELDEFGLAVSLEKFVARLEREPLPNPPTITLAIAPLALSDQMALALFRIAQEALRNVRKHAQAHHAWLSVTAVDDRAVLEISDDGRGLGAPIALDTLANNGHFGLVGIAEQVEFLGGQLTVTNRPGGGTCLRVSVPLRDDEG